MDTIETKNWARKASTGRKATSASTAPPPNISIRADPIGRIGRVVEAGDATKPPTNFTSSPCGSSLIVGMGASLALVGRSLTVTAVRHSCDTVCDRLLDLRATLAAMFCDPVYRSAHFLGCSPTSGCRRFRRAFPVAGNGATTPVAVGTFCLEAVRFVCVHDMSCVPACYVVGPESPHLIECEGAVWAPVVGVCVCRPPDERCRLLVVRCVVVCLVGVPHYSNFLSSDVVSAIGPGYPVRYDKH